MKHRRVESGTSFNKERDALRLQLATTHLKGELVPLSSIPYLSGFQDAGGFFALTGAGLQYRQGNIARRHEVKLRAHETRPGAGYVIRRRKKTPATTASSSASNRCAHSASVGIGFAENSAVTLQLAATGAVTKLGLVLLAPPQPLIRLNE